ncbi:ankyrin repeat-containing protein ITN1-like [Telopea speciosissima]|uniref:ankyrin repeat-containing protein ITN1-like n=1 Tax=Telopea speciosissima TaxID=54955 RepID=UPI001CC62CA9|nr:ankyrin repeat-containing protein ITN1-like [Telopea speciosissima]
MESYMSPRLYKAAATGDVHYLSSNEISEELILSSDTESEERKERLRRHLLCLTHEKNNCLHIAARFGYKAFVERVLTLCPSLVYHQNKRGDNPLHVAARAGHLRIVELLTDSFKKLQSPQSTENNRAVTGEGNNENNTEPPRTSQSQSSTRNSATTGDDITLGSSSTGEIVNGITSSEKPSLPIWRTENNYGNTALHEALLSKHKKVAFHLLDLNSELVILVVNTKGESPLYLAAEAGFVTVVDKILGAGGRNNVVGPMGQTALHARITTWALRKNGAPRGRVRPLMRLPIWDPNSVSTTAKYTNMTKAANTMSVDAATATVQDTDMTQLANTMSVVAALLVTIIFAAAFTIPGGLKVDGSGSPSLIHKPTLIIFCISNTIAMCFSMAALLPFLLATFSFSHSVSSRSTIYQSTFIIFGAACSAMIAFISGFYAVISIESTWLGIVVCIIGSSLPILVKWTQHADSIVTTTLRVPAVEANKMGSDSPPTVAGAGNDPNNHVFVGLNPSIPTMAGGEPNTIK